jgi:hypothetical protein
MKENPGYIELKHIEAATDIATTLAKSSNKIVLGAETLMFNRLSL